ncbi:MAG: BON domain-containing protein [Planctomycetota bacterium]|jgi:osmotically-inducible protein OsmY
MISDPKKDFSGRLPSHAVARAAKARLRTTPYPSVQKVSCECDDQGVLFLRGRLGSFYHKQLAQEAVTGLPGVAQVVNETEVAA